MTTTRAFEAHCFTLLHSGLDHIDQGISVFDRELRLVGWNRRFLELLDLPARLTWRGADFASIMRYNAQRGEYGPGDIEELVEARVQLAMKFEPHALERVRPTGGIIAIRGEPLPEGGFVTVYTDVTDQRRYERVIREHTEELEWRVAERTREVRSAHDRLLGAMARQREVEAALRQSEARLQLIADSLPAGIAYWDKNDCCLFANRRFAAAFGLRKEQVIGRPSIDVVGRESLAAVQGYIDTVLGGSGVTFEHQVTLASGRVAMVRSTLLPDTDADGGVAGYFVLSLDITRHKQAEDAILQAQKMEAIGQLSSGIAHDFNNLLTVILGNLLPLGENPADVDDIREYIDPAIEAARKGAKLTERLLTFARRQPLSPELIDVEALVAGAVRLLRRSLPSDIEIITVSRGQPYPALADAYQLENALLNLAFNSRDAMPNGGCLKLETTFVRIGAGESDEAGVDPGDYVRISVTDTGAGMDAATQARVFEPFFSTKQEQGGSGLGLSMVYGFVQESGGAIRIESASGRGTTIVMLLPRGDVGADAEQSQATPSAPQTAPNGDLVLLVEDDDKVRAVVRRQLMTLGYHLIEAANAEEALELLRNVRDLTMLLTDIVMPGSMSGVDLGRAAKSLKPDLKVLLMTGYAGQDRMRELEDASFPLLQKPFDQQQLAAAIATASATATV
ncbi:MAG: PAS-domain containing protein [Rhodospirillales bacterium]|nr:PAS-domain containing protein [Rhodospirillales bacterium]